MSQPSLTPIALTPTGPCTSMPTYANFLPANKFLLQGEYLNQSIKPKAMDCYTLNSHLGLMNTLSILLPGSGGNQLLPDTLSHKNMFFKLMLAEWQLKLTSNGIVLDDANYTINQLVDFMEQQHIFWDAEQEAKQRRHNYQPGRYNSYNCESYAPGRFGSHLPNDGSGHGPPHPPQGPGGSPYGQHPRFGFGCSTLCTNHAPNTGRRGQGPGGTPFCSPYNLHHHPTCSRGPPPPGTHHQLHYYMIQFPPEMDEDWVRYGLAKLGQISKLPNWQRMLFCAYTTQLLHSTGEVCWNNKDSYFIWFKFVC